MIGSFIVAIFIMVVGLLINYHWYQKHDESLFRCITNMLYFDDDFFMTVMAICLFIAISLIPLLNIIMALSINIGLFIRGVE